MGGTNDRKEFGVIMDLSYHVFLFGGWLYIVSGILMTLFIGLYVRSEWVRKKRVSVLDIVGIISWLIMSWCPIVNFALAIVIGIHRVIGWVIDLMLKAEDKIIYEDKS